MCWGTVSATTTPVNLLTDTQTWTKALSPSFYLSSAEGNTVNQSLWKSVYSWNCLVLSPVWGNTSCNMTVCDSEKIVHPHLNPHLESGNQVSHQAALSCSQGFLICFFKHNTNCFIPSVQQQILAMCSLKELPFLPFPLCWNLNSCWVSPIAWVHLVPVQSWSAVPLTLVSVSWFHCSVCIFGQHSLLLSISANLDLYCPN